MIRLFLFLMLALNMPLAFADIVFPVPPQILNANDINDAKPVDVLAQRIQALVEKGSDEKIIASPVLEDEQQIILSYEYTYGWRATDIAVQTLIYKKNNQSWDLSATINGSISAESFIGDLNGDGISELLVKNSAGFRTQFEETQTLMLFDEAQKKYVPGGLVARSMGIKGECDEVENEYEKISVRKSQPRPVIIITREIKIVDKVTCDEHFRSITTTEYTWASDQNKFIQISSKTISEPEPKQNRSDKSVSIEKDKTKSFWDWLTSWK